MQYLVGYAIERTIIAMFVKRKNYFLAWKAKNTWFVPICDGLSIENTNIPSKYHARCFEKITIGFFLILFIENTIIPLFKTTSQIDIVPLYI